MSTSDSLRRRRVGAGENIYTRGQIEDLIAQGGHIVIVDGEVLKCDSWLHHHPGGDKVIKHMVGRDGTDEMNAYVAIVLLMRNDSAKLCQGSIP